MKLTEAQLKAIIAEEVQAAIEEGLFGAIGGAAKGLAGLAGKAAGAVGRAASAAGGKAYSALDRGISAAERGLDVVGRGVGGAIGAVADAGGEVLDAARMGSLKADVNKSVSMASNTIQQMFKLASQGKGKPEFAQLLNDFAQELADVVEEAEKLSARIPSEIAGNKKFDPTRSMEEQIAESIVRRITQESKRRR